MREDFTDAAVARLNDADWAGFWQTSRGAPDDLVDRLADRIVDEPPADVRRYDVPADLVSARVELLLGVDTARSLARLTELGRASAAISGMCAARGVWIPAQGPAERRYAPLERTIVTARSDGRGLATSVDAGTVFEDPRGLGCGLSLTVPLVVGRALLPAAVAAAGAPPVAGAAGRDSSPAGAASPATSVAGGASLPAVGVTGGAPSTAGATGGASSAARGSGGASLSAADAVGGHPFVMSLCCECEADEDVRGDYGWRLGRFDEQRREACPGYPPDLGPDLPKLRLSAPGGRAWDGVGQLGGRPQWLQALPQWPGCCGRPMWFVGQLRTGEFGGVGGAIYGFRCECGYAAQPRQIA